MENAGQIDKFKKRFGAFSLAGSQKKEAQKEEVKAEAAPAAEEQKTAE